MFSTPAAVDAANFGDLERRDRLPVGDHRERLERLHRQLLRRALVEQAPHPLVQVRSRDDLVAAGHFDQLQAARAFVVALQLGERRVDRPRSGSDVSSLPIAFRVSGSGEAKISASRIAFSSALARRLPASSAAYANGSSAGGARRAPRPSGLLFGLPRLARQPVWLCVARLRHLVVPDLPCRPHLPALPFLFVVSHVLPPGRQSGAARRTVATVCRRESVRTSRPGRRAPTSIESSRARRGR